MKSFLSAPLCQYSLMLDSACKLMQELSVRVAVIVVSVSGVSGESGVSSAKLLTGSAVRQVFPPAPPNPIPRQPPNHPHISQA